MPTIAFFLTYAYPILFLWVLGEQLGMPIPSIPLLLTAGTLTATHKLTTAGSLAAVLLACFVADSFWFFLGRKYGGSVLKLLCRFSLEASTCVAKTHTYFNKRGAVTLLFAKYIPGLSTVAAPIAGESGTSYPRFLLYDMAGSFVWALSFLLVGRFFGDLAKKSAPFLALLAHFALVLVGIMVVGFFLQRVIKRHMFLKQVHKMRLEPEELMALIEAAESDDLRPFIVDLRHPLDYLPDPRVLPGAVRVGPTELEKNSHIIPRNRDVILYCTCPSEETSSKVALQLRKVGIVRVRPLRGGFDGWKNAGYPLHDYDETAHDLPTPVKP